MVQECGQGRPCQPIINNHDVLGKVMVVKWIMWVTSGCLTYNNGAKHAVCSLHPSMAVPVMGTRVFRFESGESESKVSSVCSQKFKFFRFQNYLTKSVTEQPIEFCVILRVKIQTALVYNVQHLVLFRRFCTKPSITSLMLWVLRFSSSSLLSRGPELPNSHSPVSGSGHVVPYILSHVSEVLPVLPYILSP